MITKILAFICQICPLCIFARVFPDSKFAGIMNDLEKSCPFCRAYRTTREG